MSPSEFCEQVRDHAQKLADLMSSPEPDLWSWVMAVTEHAGWIEKWWSGKMTEEDQ